MRTTPTPSRWPRWRLGSRGGERQGSRLKEGAAQQAATAREEAAAQLRQQLVAIEAKHQQGTAKLGAEVRELRHSLATESTALQAAQALNEKLFNETHSVT